MIMRWFAEDCPAGKIAFPTKPGGTAKRKKRPFYIPVDKFFGRGPLVSHLSVREVLKRTCLVEPMGL